MGINLYAKPYITVDDLNEEGLLPKTSIGNRTSPASTLGEDYAVGSTYLVNATTLATGKINSLYVLLDVSATTAATPVYTSVWRGVPLVADPNVIVQSDVDNRTYPGASDDDLPKGSLFVVSATTLATGKTTSLFVCTDNASGTATWRGVAVYADPAQMLTDMATAPSSIDVAPLGSKWYVNNCTAASMAIYEVVKVRSASAVQWVKLA